MESSDEVSKFFSYFIFFLLFFLYSSGKKFTDNELDSVDHSRMGFIVDVWTISYTRGMWQSFITKCLSNKNWKQDKSESEAWKIRAEFSAVPSESVLRRVIPFLNLAVAGERICLD